MGPPVRIHIFGASGSGTSTLGKHLATELGCAHFDADDYFWQPSNPPYQNKHSRDDRMAALSHDAAEDGDWVVSGCIAGWGEWIKPRLTLGVLVLLDHRTRMARLRAREISEFGQRVLEGGDMHKTHNEFMTWASSYDTAGVEIRSRALHEQWVSELSCPVLHLDSSNPVEQLTGQVVERIDPSDPSTSVSH